MPFRSRLRRAFTRGSQDDPQLASKSKSKSKPDPNVYQPGEKMPPLKYRRPVNPEHKAHLESFNWAKAWRRKSDQSIYSPMGSRMPSRKSSFQSFGRRSIGTRSIGRRSKSMSRGDDVSGVDSGIGASVAGDERPEQVREGSDEEGDVTNVGLSRHPTEDPRSPRRKSSSSRRRRSQSLKSGSSRPQTSDHPIQSHSASKGETPFTPEDLELALKKSNLEATKEEFDQSGVASPGLLSPAAAQSRPRERLIAFHDEK